LHYLPPTGRITEMWLEERGEHFDLMARAAPLPAGEAAADMAIKSADGDTSGSPNLDLEVSFEPRNFTATTVAEIESSAPVATRHLAMHSHLPPLIWALAGSGGLVAASAIRQYVDAFTRALGEANAKGLVTWLADKAKKAKDPGRENLAEFTFSTDSGLRVAAFCPFHPESMESLDALKKSMAMFSDLGGPISMLIEGATAKELRHVAFFWDAGQWHLAWWASDSQTHVTQWFKNNAPKPANFLGREEFAGQADIEYHMGPGFVSLGDPTPAAPTVSLSGGFAASSQEDLPPDELESSAGS
jgi:hypothetical protein